MTMSTQQKKVSNTFINLYGLGDFGFQIMVNMELVFFMVFLTDAVRFAPETAGLIGSITGFFDVLWVFVAGLVVQKVNFRRGKLRTWLLLTPPLIWAFFIFQFWGFSGNTSLASFLICMGFIVSHLIWNCCYTAHLSMISSYTNDMQQRTTLSARRMVGQNVGKILFSAIAAGTIASINASTGSTALGYTYTAMILTLFMVAGYWIVFGASKKYEPQYGSKAELRDAVAKAPKAEKVPVWKNITSALRNSQLIVLIVTDFGRCFAFYLVTAVTAYYFRVVIGDASQMTRYLLLINIAGAVAAFLAPNVAKALGKKTTYFLGLFGYAAGLILVYFFAKTSAVFMVIMLVASGLLQLSFSMGTAMFADTVVYGEWKTGVNSRGFIMGLYSLPIKTSVLVRAAFVGAMLAAMSYVPDAVTPAMVDGMRNLFALYPSIALVVFGLFGLIFYKLTDKRVSEQIAEIEARRES